MTQRDREQAAVRDKLVEFVLQRAWKSGNLATRLREAGLDI